METITGRIFVPHYMEYLTVNQDLQILEATSGVQGFADCADQLIPGTDVRFCFPELIGIEDDLMDILQGRQKHFEFPGISRNTEFKPLIYFNLYIASFEAVLIVLLEDVTERMLLEQRLVQKCREYTYLSKV